MNTYVIAHTNLFDNSLTLEIVTANTPDEAIWKHSKLQDPCWQPEDAGDNLEEIKEYLFNCDVLASVIEVGLISVLPDG